MIYSDGREMSADVYILGVAMNRFGRHDEGVKAMAQEVITECLADAKLNKEDIQAAFFSNTFWGMFGGQHSIRGEIVFRSLGMDKIPVVNVENACAGASTAMYLGAQIIKAGTADVVIACGSEKITHEDKALSLAAYGACMELANTEETVNGLMAMGAARPLEIPGGDTPPGTGRSIFMDAYAAMARWHMAKYGTTQRQLAEVAAKNHYHSSLNPKAQYNKVYTTDEVLNDKPVTYPLTRAMCAPVGDGAAAVILVSGRYLAHHPDDRAVRLRVCMLGQGSDRDFDGEDLGERIARQAYAEAGLGPDDIDVAELHDATAYGELHQYESMGFCPQGKGGAYAESGATRLYGDRPVNTSGGLESRGHPIGASGLAQIYELVTQLRGEAGERQVQGARVALAENGGGSIGIEESVMCISILDKTETIFHARAEMESLP